MKLTRPIPPMPAAFLCPNNRQGPCQGECHFNTAELETQPPAHELDTCEEAGACVMHPSCPQRFGCAMETEQPKPADEPLVRAEGVMQMCGKVCILLGVGIPTCLVVWAFLRWVLP